MQKPTHPQYAELLENLRSFLAAPVGFHGGVLHVYNPSPPAGVEFYDPEVFQGGTINADGVWELAFEQNPAPPVWNPEVGEKWMRFFWPGEPVPATIERLRPVAESLGLPPPSIEYDEFLAEWGLAVPSFPPARVTVDDPAAAARLCLRVLAEVHGMGTEDWLWITDIVQPEDWPSPLPRPARWPPDA